MSENTEMIRCDYCEKEVTLDRIHDNSFFYFCSDDCLELYYSMDWGFIDE